MEKEKKHKTADGFKEWLKRHLGINPERSKGRNRDSFRYLNINPEGVLLKESQDITDELNMSKFTFELIVSSSQVASTNRPCQSGAYL